MLKVPFHISSVESLGVYHLLSVQSFPEGGAEFSMRRNMEGEKRIEQGCSSTPGTCESPPENEVCGAGGQVLEPAIPLRSERVLLISEELEETDQDERRAVNEIEPVTVAHGDVQCENSDVAKTENVKRDRTRRGLYLRGNADDEWKFFGDYKCVVRYRNRLYLADDIQAKKDAKTGQTSEIKDPNGKERITEGSFHFEVNSTMEEHAIRGSPSKKTKPDLPSGDKSKERRQDMHSESSESEDDDTDTSEDDTAPHNVTRSITFSGTFGITRSGSSLYTPLQKWEYDNNLPVDGVSDVKKWAADVGLADAEGDQPKKSKRPKTGHIVEPPKYAGSSSRIFLTSEDDQEVPSDDDKDAQADADEDRKRKGKGKEE